MAGHVWSHDETLALIEIWTDETIQLQLTRSCVKNKAVYQDISNRMMQKGFGNYHGNINYILIS